jgi:hypothetical protein
MRKFLLGFVLALSLAAIPTAAHAFGVEASVGKGFSIDPVKAQPTNLMVAPGIQLLWLRANLGIAADLPDVEASKFDLGLRPMISLHPPILPIYGKLIFAFQNLFHEDRRTFAYGGALGLEIALAGIGIFAEAGLLPRDPKGEVGFQWVAEGRLGLSLGF